jgi:uncharacterized protein (DUF736 family)
MSKYPKSEGAMFANKKSNEKQPDFRGKVAITKDQIKTLIEMGKAGQDVVLQLAAWNRKSQAGQTYLYVSAEAYMKAEASTQDLARFAPDDDDDIPF